MIRVKRGSHSRIRQGDIYKDVEYLEYMDIKGGVVEISKIVFPLVVVLTQDCDLEQDHRFRSSRGGQSRSSDKRLISILVAPLYNAEHVYMGEHLSELGLSMEPINKKKSPGEYLRKNERPRYHYLEFDENTPIVPSVIDFKHYFSVNMDYLKTIKKTNFVCTVSNLYREDISQRFTGYLARIGLPDVTQRQT